MSGNARSVRLLDVNDTTAEIQTRLGTHPEAATAAFEQAYQANRATVLRFLRAFTGDDEAALELASITFERAWSECRHGRAIGLGWLLRTARNAAIDATRRSAVRDRFARIHRDSSTDASPEDIAIQRDSGAILRTAVASLPSPQREALVLRFTTGLAVREIAELIGKREDATEKLISRTIDKLREDLHERI